MVMMSRNWNGGSRRRVNAVNIARRRNDQDQKTAPVSLRRLERFLVSVNVVGSTGALRYLVNVNDAVSSVIDAALESYAREGRLPALGSDPKHFLLYSAAAPSQALSPEEMIGRSCDGGRSCRKFVMCKKQEIISPPAPRKYWKAWLKKTLLSLIHLALSKQ